MVVSVTVYNFNPLSLLPFIAYHTSSTCSLASYIHTVYTHIQYTHTHTYSIYYL